jgi:large subunit ribosomal protein L4
MKVKLHKLDGGKPSEVDLNLTTDHINVDLLHRVVCMQLTNRRSGTASTKGRGEVSGGGRKPWRQKYTGRARHGSIRSPLWRGGGVIFGPKPKEYYYKLPKKMRKAGLRMAITARCREGRLLLIDKLEFERPKTKEGCKLLERLGLEDALIIISSGENNYKVIKTFSNIPQVKCLPSCGANVYDILRYENLLITQKGLEELEERLL